MTDTSKSNSSTIEIYEWSEEIRGVILSSFFWGYTIMQIPAGILAKRFGGKPMLLSALIINGILCLVTPALAKVLASCRACTHCWVAGPASGRTRLSIIAYTGIQLGTILTMPVCGLLSQSNLGWTLIFYTMGALASGAAVIWWAFAGSTPREHRWMKEPERDYIESSLNSSGKPCPPIPWRNILTSVPLRATAVAHIGMNWCFIIFLVEMPTYLKQALNIDLSNGSTLSALPFVAQWVVQVIAGVISDYLYNKQILSISGCRKLFNTIGCVGASIGLITMSFMTSEHKTLAVIVMAFTGGILACCSCGYCLNHIDLSPNFGGVMFAITNCFANLIGILAPLSTGFILGDHPTDIARWRIVFFFAASLLLGGDMAFRFFGTSELQAWNDPLPDQYELAKENTMTTNEEKKIQEVLYSFQENKD
ncbi:putative inorganic phosphate cotransporter [Choristoneura fumiferana]|uniref:putative inorganic phosphate cotransporter n=1 Tax=Choristoneura fumiferana TaxID=7141 RepID=UPI003D153C78